MSTDWEKEAREHIDRIHRRFPNRDQWVPSARWLAMALDEIDNIRDPSLLAEIKRGREEIAKLRGVVSASATQFEFYVEQHLAKSPPDTAKAVVNKAHAEQCRAALEGKDNGD